MAFTEQRCLFDKCGFLRTQYCRHKRINIFLYWIADDVYWSAVSFTIPLMTITGMWIACGEGRGSGSAAITGRRRIHPVVVRTLTGRAQHWQWISTLSFGNSYTPWRGNASRIGTVMAEHMNCCHTSPSLFPKVPPPSWRACCSPASWFWCWWTACRTSYSWYCSSASLT